jgi:hypothetical protein
MHTKILSDPPARANREAGEYPRGFLEEGLTGGNLCGIPDKETELTESNMWICVRFYPLWRE